MISRTRFSISSATVLFLSLSFFETRAETLQSSAPWTLQPAGNVRQRAPGTANDSDSPTMAVLLPKFDSSLGTLQSVTINFATTQSQNDIRLTGTRNGFSAASVAQTLSYSLASPAYSAGTSQTFSDNTILDVFNASQQRGTIAGIVLNDTHAFLAAEQLSPFIGIGTFLVSITTVNNYSIATNNSTDNRLDINGSIAGTVGVTYNYALVAVPEPTTLVPFAGTCVAGIVAAKRRRRAATARGGGFW